MGGAVFRVMTPQDGADKAEERLGETHRLWGSQELRGRAQKGTVKREKQVWDGIARREAMGGRVCGEGVVARPPGACVRAGPPSHVGGCFCILSRCGWAMSFWHRGAGGFIL